MNLPKINILQKPTYLKIAEDVDFFTVFKNIDATYDNCFIFESLGEEGKFARYDILGFSPSSIITGTDDSLIIDCITYNVPNPYYALREMLPDSIIARNYAGGLIGYLGYDTVNYMESAVRVRGHDSFPPMMWGIYTDGLIHDKLTNEIFYFHFGNDRSVEVYSAMKAHRAEVLFDATFHGDDISKEQHATIVESVKNQIRAGNTFQCEVGIKSFYSISGDTIAIYEKLRSTNPSPFMYYLKFGGKRIIGASPELLLSVRDGEMTTRPLAGTTRRGANEIEDKKLARELLSDPKERAEHNMLVDLHRNDIGRVSRFGTVRVRDLMTVKKFSHVQHLSSEIVGIMKEGEDMLSALASQFPMGTVCGAPKVETIKIIDANEPVGRGPYGGGVGSFGFNGDCTFALALRSVFIDGSEAYTQTCSGIVYDSTPEKEYEEIQRKLAAMKHVLTRQ